MGHGNGGGVIDSYYLELLETVGDRFGHCFSVSAIDRPDQPLVYVNQRFEVDTGYVREDVLGRNCRFLQGDLLNQSARRTIRLAIDAQRAVAQDIINFRRDGQPFVNRLLILPFAYLSAPGDRFCVGIQRVMGFPDERQITDFAPQYQEIEHAINNPLAIALGFAELAQADTRAIDNAIGRIERYVDDLAPLQLDRASG